MWRAWQTGLRHGCQLALQVSHVLSMALQEACCAAVLQLCRVRHLQAIPLM